jgi:hypothetical protein
MMKTEEAAVHDGHIAAVLPVLKALAFTILVSPTWTAELYSGLLSVGSAPKSIRLLPVAA